MKKMARALLFLLSSEKEGILILEVPPGKRICIATVQVNHKWYQRTLILKMCCTHDPETKHRG